MPLGVELSQQISIHALREEGDAEWTEHGQRTNHFYPRPPRGGRPAMFGIGCVTRQISIHALREEGDYYHKMVCVLRC